MKERNFRSSEGLMDVWKPCHTLEVGAINYGVIDYCHNGVLEEKHSNIWGTLGP